MVNHPQLCPNMQSLIHNIKSYHLNFQLIPNMQSDFNSYLAYKVIILSLFFYNSIYFLLLNFPRSKKYSSTYDTGTSVGAVFFKFWSFAHLTLFYRWLGHIFTFSYLDRISYLVSSITPIYGMVSPSLDVVPPPIAGCHISKGLSNFFPPSTTFFGYRYYVIH